MIFFPFHKNQKQHLDRHYLNLRKRKCTFGCAITMRNFNILIITVHYSVKLHIVKIHKNAKKIIVICNAAVWCSNFY